MTFIEEVMLRETVSKNAGKLSKMISDCLKEKEEKGELKMKIQYNGLTGELVKLEQVILYIEGEERPRMQRRYNLSIYDEEKQVTYSFEGVKMENVRLLGGSVTFENGCG